MKKLTVDEISKLLFVKAIPTQYEVTIDIVEPGTKVFNPLEMTEFVATEDRCYMVTGTVGEQWFINAAKVAQKYHHISDNRYLVSGGDIVFVSKTSLYAEFEAYGDGTVVCINHPDVSVGHSDGDVLVCNIGDDGNPDFSNIWSVNGEVFKNTYKLI